MLLVIRNSGNPYTGGSSTIDARIGRYDRWSLSLAGLIANSPPTEGLFRLVSIS